MELIILGSGTGIPSLKRGSPGFLVKTESQSILLDGGSGTLQRLLKAGVTYRELDAVLYTHIHPDHCADLVPLLFACKYQEEPRLKELLIIGGPGFRDYLAGLQWVHGSWIEAQTFRLRTREVAVDEIAIGDLLVRTLPLDHMQESIGYRITSPQGQTLVYSGDTDYCPNIIELARDAGLLLLECSFPEGKKVPGHLTPALAGRIAQEAGSKRLCLTHFYPPCDQADVKAACQKSFAGEVLLAEDMMRIAL